MADYKLREVLRIMFLSSLLSLILLGASILAADVVEDISHERLLDLYNEHQYVLVLFTKDNCPQCQNALQVLQETPQPDTLSTELHRVMISDPKLASTYGIFEFPKFLFFRDGIPAMYTRDHISVEAIEEWVYIAADSSTKILTDDTFEHLTQAATGATTGDWLIIFYEPACSTALLVMESVAVEKKGLMNVAKVDMTTSPKLKNRFNIKTCPHIIFFQQGRMYRYGIEKYNTKSILAFVNTWYKNMKKESVPIEPSAFDIVVDSIVVALKSHLEGPNRGMFLAIVGTMFGAVSLVLSCCLCRCQRGKKIKYE